MSRSELSLRRRLTSILLSVSTAVVLVTTAAFCAYELVAFRRTTSDHLLAMARVIAANSAASLAFNDRSDATEMLNALQSEPGLEMAVLYNEAGEVFATYPSHLSDETPPSAAQASRAEVSWLEFELGVPVLQGDRRLGTLYLRADLSSMRRRMLLYGAIVTFVVLAACLVGYAFSSRLQREITEPILSLADTARAVSEKRDYSVRCAPRTGDELGLLTTAFNHMLTQIQERDLALREGAERMRAVLDSTLSAVVVVNASGTVIDWTARSETIFGWPRQEAIGRDLADLVIPSDEQDRYRRVRTSFLRTGRSPFLGKTFETTARRRDGTLFPVEISIQPLKTGREITFCAFVTDITERLLAEKEIRALTSQLEQRVHERTAQLESANHELEAFSYSVSHDLRAPLRHIDGFARMLAQHAGPTLDAQGRRYLDTISDSARHMGRLIDDLLAFSRTGRAALKLVVVDQDALVADVITEGNFQQNDRAVEWDMHPLPQVCADALLLRLVWRNLVGNAVKYSSRSPRPRIEIGTIEPSTPTEHVMYVRDNGVGFDMRYAAKLFGVFQRLHSQTDFEGTGIGLAHVKRIVTRHGGRVWAESELGAGATFYFSLPVVEPPSCGTALPFS